MGTRHRQLVITKKGERKISQYGQWDGYPKGQGGDILEFLKTANLKKYQAELEKIKPITEEQERIVETDKEWKKNYPYLSRDCGADIHKMVEEGKVKFVDLISDEEANKWCEGFYTIDFQKNVFISKFHGITREFSLDDLPSKEEYLKSFEMSDAEWEQYKQYDKILQEAKDELDLCGLEWKDEYLDVANHTPPFDLGCEKNAIWFAYLMGKLSMIKK